MVAKIAEAPWCSKIGPLVDALAWPWTSSKLSSSEDGYGKAKGGDLIEIIRSSCSVKNLSQVKPENASRMAPSDWTPASRLETYSFMAKHVPSFYRTNVNQIGKFWKSLTLYFPF